MTGRKTVLVFAAVCTVVGLFVGAVISSQVPLFTKANATEKSISQESIDVLSRTNNAITEIVAAVQPSVVNISSSKTVKSRGMNSPFLNDPFFEQFFGDKFDFNQKPREYKQSGLGSGVIVDKDGFILTNNHVIKGADEIKVKLSDDREFVGKVIGTDQKTDLAVIKIDSNNLPVIRLGDSDALKVGEMVLTVGNPFGLSHTVTSGIVSATGRANVGIADYEDFIQTDAPINPGNSGGALVNIKGELVGINTAIFSTTGGYQGIGFAIPSNMAKVVMESLIKKGKVVRGWLGIYIQPITPDLAKQFNLKDDKGALVGDVIEDSPAEKAGIQRGDVIVEFDGKDVDDAVGLRNLVAATAPNRKVAVKIIRNGSPKTLNITIDELSEESQKVSGDFDNNLSGVFVQNITPELRRNLAIPKRVNGVIITDIKDDSKASGLLRKDDIIMEVNKKQIDNTKDYDAIVSKITSNEDVLLLVSRKGTVFYVTLSVK